MSARGMLAFEEGRRNVAYRCTRGVWTIGIGHTGPEVCAGLVWADALIDSTFDADYAKAIAGATAALPWFGTLNEPRQAVLISMCFQLGQAGMLAFKNTLAAVRDGRYEDAARGMTNSLWAKQTPLRVARQAEQMLTGVWNPLYTKDTHGT